MKKNYGTGGLNTFYAVLKAEGDAETSMSQANLGHVLRVFDVALTAAQLAQMFSYFDRTCCGRISLSSVMDGFRACNPASCTPYRQALINAAFANNDDGAGSIDMSCLPFDDSSGLTQVSCCAIAGSIIRATRGGKLKWMARRAAFAINNLIYDAFFASPFTNPFSFFQIVSST